MSRRRIVFTLGASALIFPLLAPTVSWAAAPTPPQDLKVNRVSSKKLKDTRTIIVTFDSKQSDPKAATTAAVEAAVQQAGADIAQVKPITSKMVAVTLDQEVTAAQANEIGAAAESVDGVKAAEPSGRMSAAETNDSYYSYQWDLSPDAGSGYSVNAEAAWGETTGSGTVVAVLDTGITAHPDLTGSGTSTTGGNVIAGYDFITDSVIAGDGTSWDSNPSDPGDYCTDDDSDSSWHGSHVSGIVAALANNAEGIAGVAPGTKVQPIRVLGRCGGEMADIIPAIRWGAGLSVSGVPTNPNPADVLNLSLSANDVGPCSPALQSAVNEAIAAGTTIVVAAGNNSQAVVDHSPANCAGVISVAATGPDGQLAGFSNYGTSAKAVTISAPGGSSWCAMAPDNCVLSTVNSGAKGPEYPDYGFMIGTSQAAPHVAAVAAELKSVNPSLSPAQIKSILTSTATAANGCSTTKCGAGIVNAGAAVAAAAGVTPPAGLAGAVPTVSGTAKVGNTLTATVGTWGPSPVSLSYAWFRSGSAIDGATGTTYQLAAADKGHQITIRVSGRKAGYTTTVKQSVATAEVAAGTLTTAKPTISGKAKVGKKLTAKAGTWGPGTVTLSYTWYRSGKKISGATKSTYKLTKKDKRKKITVKVTGKKSGYQTASQTSKATSKVK